MRRCAVSLVVFLAWQAAVGIGQAPRDRATVAAPKPPPGRGLVSGIVLTADTRRQPLRRVVVTLSGGSLPLGRSTVTDDQGRFSIEGLPAGRFTLSATKPTYLPTAYGATRPGRPAVAIDLSEGQRLENVALAMTRGAVISGNVADSQGMPAAGVQITASRVLADGVSVPTTQSTVTDDHGEYRIFGLPPSQYLVTASYSIAPLDSNIVAMSSAEIDAILSALEHRQSARGFAPVVASARTRSVALAAVFYPGVFDPAQAIMVAVAAGDDRRGINITMQQAQVASVQGTIVSSSGATANVPITLAQKAPDLPNLAATLRQTRSDATGQFTFNGLGPGAYIIDTRATDPPGAASGRRQMLWGRTEISLNGDDLSGLTLVLQPALRLRGRVVFAGSTRIAPGDLSNLRVSASNATDAMLQRRITEGMAVNTLPPSAVVQADGSFTLLGLTPGRYTIAASQRPDGWWLRSAMIGNQDVLDLPLDIASTADALPPLVLTFSDRHTVLSGTLYAEPTRTEAAYYVVVFPSDRTLWHGPSRRVATTRPGTDARFIVRDLPPGNYLMGVVADFEPDDLLDRAFYEKIAPTALTVAIADGERKVQNLTIRVR